MEAPKQIDILAVSDQEGITGQYELANKFNIRFSIIKDRQFNISFEHQLSVLLYKIGESYYWIRNTMSYIDVENQLFIDEGIEVVYQKINE